MKEIKKFLKEGIGDPKEMRKELLYLYNETCEDEVVKRMDLRTHKTRKTVCNCAVSSLEDFGRRLQGYQRCLGEVKSKMEEELEWVGSHQEASNSLGILQNNYLDILSGQISAQKEDLCRILRIVVTVFSEEG